MAIRKEYHSVTEELINILKTHITIGSLRRDCAMAKQIIEQREELNCPRLFYVLLNNEWEVHAVELDLLRYLLYIDANNPRPIKPEPGPDFFIKSKFYWDKLIGKTENGAWSTPVTEDAGVCGSHLIIDGEIKYYESGEVCDVAGNFVGAIINPSVEMLAHYPDAEITFWDIHETYKLYEVNCSGFVRWISEIRCPGQESRVTIKWSDTLTESFVLMVTQNSTLENGDRDDLSCQCECNCIICYGTSHCIPRHKIN